MKNTLGFNLDVTPVCDNWTEITRAYQAIFVLTSDLLAKATINKFGPNIDKK